MSENSLFSDSLTPVPGYEGVYYITPSGDIVNRNNNVLKTFPTKHGDAVELRSRGQRERILVSELIEKVKDSNENIGTD